MGPQMSKQLFEELMGRIDVEISCDLDLFGNTMWTFVHPEWVYRIYTEA